MKRERTKPKYTLEQGMVENYYSICPYCEDKKPLDAYAIAHADITLETVCHKCSKRYRIEGGY